MFSLKANRATYGLYIAILIGLAAIAFGNLRTHDHWDGWDDWDMMADMRIIAQNPSMLFSAERIYEVRPPVDLIFLSGYLIWGENPVGYHLLQIALHVFASLLAACVFFQLGANLELSLLGGLLFLINAAHFRAVHWIICINYVLALIFCLLLILSFTRFLANRRRVYLLGALASFALAMLSHPSAASAALYCAYLAWRRTESLGQTICLSLPLLIAIPILAAVVHALSPAHTLQSEGLFSTPNVQRLITNVFWYPGRLVSSAHWLTRETASNAQPLWELGLGALFIIGTGLLLKRRVFPAADWAVWAIVSMLPFVNNRLDRLAFGPSRQLYLASLGASLVLAWGIHALTSRFSRSYRRPLLIGIAAIFIASGTISLKRAEALSFYFGARGYAFRNETDQEKRLKAIDLFLRARSHAPDILPEDFYIRLGTLSLTMGAFPTPIFESALQKDPSALDAQLMLGIAEYMNPDTRISGDARVQKAFEKSTDKKTFRTHAALGYLNLSTYYEAAGQPETAIQLLQKALFWKPDYALALANLSVLIDKQRGAEDAFALVQKAIELNPKDVNILTKYAHMLYNANRIEEALPIYRKIAFLAPHDPAVAYRFGQVLTVAGKREEARRTFQRAVYLDPDSRDAWLNLGNTCYQMGDFEAATRAYRKLVALNSEDISALNNLGFLLYKQDALQEAEQVLMRAQALSPDHPGTQFRLGLLYEKQKRFEDALKAYQKTLIAEPDNKEARKQATALAWKLYPEVFEKAQKK